MAFYTYIILDGYRYKTLARAWKPQTNRAATARLTLQGNVEATYGPGVMLKWDGMISTPHGESAPTPADGTQYGNIFTLRATVKKTANVSFTDHYGNVYASSSLIGPFDETMLTNVWNSSANNYYVRVAIVAKG